MRNKLMAEEKLYPWKYEQKQIDEQNKQMVFK